jgi:hypothetical protein
LSEEKRESQHSWWKTRAKPVTFTARNDSSNFLLMLALGHDCGAESGAKVVRQFVKLGVAVDLNGLFCCIANDEAVVAPLKMLFQLGPGTSIDAIV